MIREEFEAARLNIDAGRNTDDDDAAGDKGLGRQQLLLKWLIEGTYIEIPDYDLSGKEFKEILDQFKQPLDVNNDGQPDEPTHIPRLEGYEWSKLQELEAFASGALIRIKGSDKVGTSLHAIFKKDLHKIAKAAIRAALARMVATDTSNRLVADYNLDSPTCINVSDSYDPYLWPIVDCDSFAHHIASVAARLVRDFPDLDIFSVEEVKDLIYRFYKVKTGQETIASEEDANEFIGTALEFIQSVGDFYGEARTIYNQTIVVDPRRVEREENLAVSLDLITQEKANGKKQIIPRVFNAGMIDVDDLQVRMYVGDQEVARESVSVKAGESVYLDKRKEPRPQPDDPPNTARGNVPIFVLELDQTDSDQSGWISFLVDLPFRKALEAERENNWINRFFYVLHPSYPSVPSETDDPNLSDILHEPAEPLLEPDPVCKCLRPKIEVILSIEGTDTKTLYVGGDVVFADLLVKNNSGQTMNEVKVYRFESGQKVLIEDIAEIPVGGQETIKVSYFPTSEPSREEKEIWIEYKDDEGTQWTIGSNLLVVETQCRIALVALDPDPNPQSSEIMDGGTFCRYYRVIDRSTNDGPLANAVLRADLTIGDIISTRSFTTDEDGFVITELLTEDPLKGMCVPWYVWADMPELPLDGSYPVKGELMIDETWLLAELPNECVNEPVKFDLYMNKFAFEEAFKAGASSSLGASLEDPTGSIGVSGSLGWGTGLELLLSGQKEGQDQGFNKLAIRRNDHRSEEVGFKAGLSLPKGDDYLVKPDIEVDTTVMGASHKEKVVIYDGHQYEFPIDELALSKISEIKAASVYLDTVIDVGNVTLATSVFYMKMLDAFDDLTADAASEFWGITFSPSDDFNFLGVSAKSSIASAIDVKLDFSPLGVGTVLYSSLEGEKFYAEREDRRSG
jgi:hypothetical protein